MKLSICIVTKNRPVLLARCIQSIVQQTKKPDEIVIIDGSTVINTRIRKAAGVHVVYVYRPGFSIPKARNLAVSRAHGEVVVFLDDDCELSSSAVLRIEEVFQNKEITVLVGRIVNANPNNVLMSVQQTYYDRWVEQNIIQREESVYDHEMHITGLDIAAFRRSVVLKYPFLEDVPFGIDEDLELGERLTKAGYTLYFNPNIIARHTGRRRVISLLIRNYQIGYTNEFIYRKFPKITTPLARKISFGRLLRIGRRHSKFFKRGNLLLFWFLLMVYPAFSRVGRLAFILRSTVLTITA